MSNEDNALVPADKNTELSAFTGDIDGTLARPSSIDPNDVTGTEDIEIQLPRLCIAQGLSYEMTPGDTRFIEGLTLFDMFSNSSGEIFGKGPLKIIPLRREVRRMEFTPRNEGGGLVDPDVPKGDPRLRWTWSSTELRASGGKADVPPKAMEFIEFASLVLRPNKQPVPIVVSMAQKNKWNRIAAKKIDDIVKMRHAPIYANLFTLDTHTPARNDKGTFGVFTVKDCGFIPKDSPAGAAIYAFAEEFHRSMEGKVVSTQRDGDEIDDSMAANPETPASEM